MPYTRSVTNRDTKQSLSLLERVDLAIASRMVGRSPAEDELAAAQRVIDAMRRPHPGDATFVAALLRLRGFVVDDRDVTDALTGRPGRLSPLTQEHRLARGLQSCLERVRERALGAEPPDGWFLVDLFRTMTGELPRFRNNELRRGPPWDALLYVTHPPHHELRSLLDSFDAKHCYRDVPAVFQGLHPVRQAFRILWRFARIAPFPDFNTVVAWLGMNAWLLAKGFPLLPAERGDQELLARLLGGPPPTRIVQFEARLLEQFGIAA